MPIRFAAPPHALRPRLSPEKARAACGLPANDNGRDGPDTTPQYAPDIAPDIAMVNAALRHFAEHGLAAAQHARKQAEKSHCEDDQQAFDWWLGICRALDRRMARELDAQLKDCG